MWPGNVARKIGSNGKTAGKKMGQAGVPVWPRLFLAGFGRARGPSLSLGRGSLALGRGLVALTLGGRGLTVGRRHVGRRRGLGLGALFRGGGVGLGLVAAHGADGERSEHKRDGGLLHERSPGRPLRRKFPRRYRGVGWRLTKWAHADTAVFRQLPEWGAHAGCGAWGPPRGRRNLGPRTDRTQTDGGCKPRFCGAISARRGPRRARSRRGPAR